jgi:hypothetical protein
MVCIYATTTKQKPTSYIFVELIKSTDQFIELIGAGDVKQAIAAGGRQSPIARRTT